MIFSVEYYMWGVIMNIVNLLFEWNWCTGENNVQPVFHMIKTVLEVLRIVVPIALIIMTSLDIAKKVIDPEDKDGQKKIMYRAIAALIVFLVPTLVKLTFNIIDWGMSGGNTYQSSETGLSACWR